MPTTFDSLNMSVFTLNSGAYIALLKDFSLSADNDMADGSGLADRYEKNLVVKQSQKMDFTVFQNNVNSVPCTNLDVSLWEIGGVDFLTQLRGGSINVTTVTKERSSIAAFHKLPNANRTQVEISCDLLVIDSLALINDVMAGNDVYLTAAITFGETVFSCPMAVKSSKLTINRGEMQMENVTMSLCGTPSGPGDSSLLGNILLGSTAFTVSANTGTNVYDTPDGQPALITRLNTSFSDSAIIEQQGTLEMQGSFTIS